MRGLRFGLGLGRGKAGDPPPFTVAITGLSTDSLGLYGQIGNHAALGFAVTPTTVVTQKWSASADPADAATFGTGAAPTDFAVADGFRGYLHVTDGSFTATRSFLVRRAPGTAATIGTQSYAQNTTPEIESVVPTGAGLTFSAYQASGLPAGRTIDPVFGTISGVPTTAGSGSASAGPQDQYGRRAEYVATWNWTVAATEAPAITATAVLSTRTLTVTVTSLTGTPTPTVIPNMEVNGQITPLPLVSPGVYQIVFGNSTDDLEVTGSLTASNAVGSAVFNFSTTVPANVTPADPINPTITSTTFTAGGSGQRAGLTTVGEYFGSDTLILDMAFGDTADSFAVNAAQLEAQSGGTGVIAFASVPAFVSGGGFAFTELIDPSELTVVTTLADMATANRVSFIIREANNGGVTSVQTVTVSGLDAVVATFSSATTNTVGGQVTVTMSEAIFGVPVLAQATVNVNGSPVALNAITRDGSTLVITLTNVVADTDTLTVTYTNATGAVTDALGNPIAAFTAQAVTNAVDGLADIIAVTGGTFITVEYTGTLTIETDETLLILEVN